MFAKIEEYLKYIGAVLLALVTTFSSLLGINPSGIPEEAAAEDTLCLTIAAISDTHVTDTLGAPFLATAMNDISSKDLDTDVLIVAGDCTDNGNTENWETFTSTVAKCTVKNKIIALGNHDTWTSYDSPHEYEEALALYLQYGNAIMGTSFTAPWFTREISGYTFIVLAQESSSVACDISDEQLDWADAQLAAAAAKGPNKPIFVILHQPLNHTHAVGNNEGSNGFNDEAQSEKLQAILNKYENVFYLNGHQHYGLNEDDDFPIPGFRTVERIGENAVSVNLPSFARGSYVFGGDPLIGDGLIINVYADRVELLGRNFIMHGWLDDFSVTVPLKTAVAE
jgi:predicted MPP superfamily phosphohydrolase